MPSNHLDDGFGAGRVVEGRVVDHQAPGVVLQHLAEGNGTRQTARLTGVHRDTVTRLARLAGAHARGAHDELVAFSPRDP